MQRQTREAIAELKAAVSVTAPDPGRIRQDLESLMHVMEHATGHLIASSVISLIVPQHHSPGALIHTRRPSARLFLKEE